MAASVERLDCGVCQDLILDNAAVSKLNCLHEYHEACLKPWIEEQHKNTCPLCREKITSINGIDVNIQEPEIDSDAFERSFTAVEELANALFNSIDMGVD